MTTPRSRSRPRESETRRLQKDLDTLTKTISLQQRRTASLDESLRVVTSEVAAKRELLQTVIPTPRDVQRLNQRVTLLENQLMQEKVALNRELKDNLSLRDQITEFRREKNRLQTSFRSRLEESQQMEAEAKLFSARHHSFDASESECKLALLTLREKALKRFRETEASFQEAETDRCRTKQATRNVSMSLFADNEVFVDSVSVLRLLHRKWVDKVKEQKKIVEQYNRTVRFLTDSFEEIKAATGIPSIDEMVTAFIKAYEQEQDMTEALTKLASEADFLQETLASLEEMHRQQTQEQRERVKMQKVRIEQLNEECDALRQLYEKKVSEEKQLREEMETIYEPVQELVRKFRESHLPPDYAPASQSESDLLLDIRELEHRIAYLLTYLSSGSGLPSSMFESSIATKSFGHHVRVASMQSATTGRKSIDEIEEPMTEKELRERAAQRVATAKGA